MRPCKPRAWLLGILLPLLLGLDWNPGAATWDRHFPPGVEATTPASTLEYGYVHVRPALSDDAEVWRMKELRDFLIDPHTPLEAVFDAGPTDRTVLAATPRGLYVSYVHPMLLWGPPLVERWREAVAVLLLIGAGVVLYKRIRRYRLAAILLAQWRGIPPGERYCKRCHYQLRGVTGANCPECGAPTANSIVAPQLTPLEMRRFLRGLIILAGVLFILLGMLPFFPTQLPFRLKLAWEVGKHLDREQSVTLLHQKHSFYELVTATSLIHVDPDTGAERVVCREFISHWYGDEVGYLPRSDGDTFVRVSRQGIELRDTKSGALVRTIAHAMPGLAAGWMQRRWAPQSLYPIGGDPTVQYHLDPESLEIYTLPDRHEGAPSFLHAGGTRLLVDGESVYHLRNGNAAARHDAEPVIPPTPPTGELARIAAAALSPDGRRLYIAWVHVAKFPNMSLFINIRRSFPGIVQVWDLVEHREVAQIRVLDGISYMFPYSLAVAADEKSFDLGLAVRYEQEVYTCDLAAGRATRAMIGQGNYMQTAKDPSPGGDRYFIAQVVPLSNGPSVMSITVAKYEADHRASEKPAAE